MEADIAKMVVSDLKNLHKSELPGRLQKLMFLRVIVVSILLGASIFIQVKQTRTYFGDIQTSHYLIISSIYFLTFIYVVLLRKTNDLIKLAYLQLLLDTVFVTAIIYSTGGIESIFSFLYILTIINASIILYRKGGMITASASSILYGSLLDLHYLNIIRPFGSRLIYPAEYQPFYIFYIILVNIAAFYLVAYLSSYPSEQARKSTVELKAKQDDLIKLEALNEWIIRSIRSGLITLDGYGNILILNPAAEDIFQMNAVDAIGKKVTDVLPFLSEFNEQGKIAINRKDNGGSGFVDIIYKTKKGENLFIRFSISPLIIPDGDQKGQILVFQDITEMKKIEEEMKRVEGLALIGELAAGIAHEIRNPMASISGSIQILSEGLEQDDVNKRLMDIVLRETNRLNHLINDFLLFARPKPIEKLRFKLEQLITESFELFKNSDKWNGTMNLVENFHGSTTLESDPEQIKQILWNIFLNATEAMPKGGTIRIETEIELVSLDGETQEEMIRINIRDSGEGFNEMALSHMFTPFFTTKKEGSGLGLAIVKRITEGLGGHVTGRNHPDGGAEISIFLKNASL